MFLLFLVKKTSGILFFGKKKEKSGSFLNQKKQKHESRKSPIPYLISNVFLYEIQKPKHRIQIICLPNHLKVNNYQKNTHINKFYTHLTMQKYAHLTPDGY